ncbi:YdeI/OmpD-associated family protein [Paenibacillus sp. 8b26]|uniref:YdeI/OmpD-associated family protein n=1 Tax=Paenibacillus sp. 8b26 TaxID=3424133 RepID=UPI003D6499BF
MDCVLEANAQRLLEQASRVNDIAVIKQTFEAISQNSLFPLWIMHLRRSSTNYEWKLNPSRRLSADRRFAVGRSLLHDAHGILIKQTENVQAGRQIRFTNVQEIVAMETILKVYNYEAIEVEKAGLEVNFKKNTEFITPEELQNKFDETPALKTAFEALTPGRQRAYILYFSEPKQSKTRESRVVSQDLFLG